jgi:hypothetical protein
MASAGLPRIEEPPGWLVAGARDSRMINRVPLLAHGLHQTESRIDILARVFVRRRGRVHELNEVLVAEQAPCLIPAVVE